MLQDGRAFGTQSILGIGLRRHFALKAFQKTLIVDTLSFEIVELKFLSVAADLSSETVALRLQLAFRNVLILKV